MSSILKFGFVKTKALMKKSIKYLLSQWGFQLSRIANTKAEIGTDKRPVGEMDLLLEDLKKRGLRCSSIMDVGANCAGWSIMAKKIFPQASFYLIEPQIEMKNALEDFCKKYKDSAYILAGVGSKSGVLTLTLWDDLAGSSFLVDPDSELKKIGRQRDIEIVTIDQIIGSSHAKCPDIIKLDIQGFELEALKGAKETFGFTEVYILEVSLFSFSEVKGQPVFSDVIDFMLQRDYVVYDFGGFSRRPLDGALAQCDICFVKKNGFLRQSNDWK